MYGVRIQNVAAVLFTYFLVCIGFIVKGSVYIPLHMFRVRIIALMVGYTEIYSTFIN